VQYLKIADHLFPLIQSGVKSQTIREGARVITVGEPVEFTDPNGKALDHQRMVTGARITSLKYVTESEARLDGFQDCENLYQGLKQFYPDITPDSVVTVIRFA